MVYLEVFAKLDFQLNDSTSNLEMSVPYCYSYIHIYMLSKCYCDLLSVFNVVHVCLCVMYSQDTYHLIQDLKEKLIHDLHSLNIFKNG